LKNSMRGTQKQFALVCFLWQFQEGHAEAPRGVYENL
jgi:hypothetical protein